VTLVVRERETYKQTAKVDKDGTFSTSVRLPEDLPYGKYWIEAIGPEGKVLSVAEFAKSFVDDERLERESREKSR